MCIVDGKSLEKLEDVCKNLLGFVDFMDFHLLKLSEKNSTKNMIKFVPIFLDRKEHLYNNLVIVNQRKLDNGMGTLQGFFQF